MLFKMATNKRVLQAGTEVFYQTFSSLEVQTMWNLQKNMWCVWKSIFKLKNIDKCICHYKPDLKRQSMEWKYTDCSQENVPGIAVCK